MICGQAQMVGLLPVFGACSTSSYKRGLPRLCPEPSTAKGTSQSCGGSEAPLLDRITCKRLPAKGGRFEFSAPSAASDYPR
jgi:hypothetical protein